MKICFVCNEYPPAEHGGIGSMTRTMAHALVEAGHQVRVIGLTPANRAACEFELDEGVPVWRLKAPKGRLSWIRARYLVYRTIDCWARSGFIDLVEVPDFEGMAAGWPALCVPVVARMHGSASYFADEMGIRPKPLTWFLERASLQRANFWCSCSRYTADRTKRLLRLQRSEIVTLHNPISVSATHSQSLRVSDQVVFSGTLTPKKGVISLIRAWSMVLEKCSGTELHLFGKDGRTDDGASMRDYLLSCVPPQNRGTVHFHGHVPLARLRTAFRSATVAVFPSYSEAFALAPMEAMAEACPTIYTRRASGKELIDDGVNGLLVDPDDPRNIADAIIKILKTTNMAKGLGLAGKRCVERGFSLETLLPQNVSFYLDCIRSFGQVAAKN